jgi:hypothetical protein
MDKDKLNAGKNNHDKERKEFLVNVYNQMFNDINRHILVVWQSIGTLVGAFALLSLVEKNIISLDVAAALIVLIGTWLLAHLHDAAYWYNRNLVIIANIERQFLRKQDLSHIHYYFGKHRRDNKMLTHLKIQYYLGVSLVSLVVTYHFLTRVLPGIGSQWQNFEPERCLPYLAFLSSVILLFRLWSKRKANYDEFLRNSPGINIDTTDVEYGDGHPSKLI